MTSTPTSMGEGVSDVLSRTGLGQDGRGRRSSCGGPGTFRVRRCLTDARCIATNKQRRAVALMEVAVQAKEDGKKFGVANKDQELATEIVGI